MNQLSMLFLLIDLVPRLASLGAILIVLSFILAFVLPRKGVEQFSPDHLPFQGIQRVSVWVVLVIGLILCSFTPSQTTMTHIVLSQIGEQIIQIESINEIGGELGGIAKDSVSILRKYVSELATTGTD